MKTCFKCGECKPLSEFYKHKKMADGHLNKCKECTKADTKKNRLENVDRYREYDRLRGNRQDCSYIAEYRAKYPNKYRAHRMVGNRVRSGMIKKSPCEICGSSENLHAHHDDYLKPLDIRWLCSACHSQWHKKHGEALNP